MKLVSTRLRHSGTRLEQVDHIDQHTVLQLTDRVEDLELETIVANKGTPGFVVATWYSYFDARSGIPVHCVPIYLEYLAKFWRQRDLIHNPPTEKSFNFLINKKQINRYLAIKFVQHFDLLDNAAYTYSGMGRYYDMSSMMADLDVRPWITPELKTHILQPIDLPARWIPPAEDSIKFPRATTDQITREAQQDFARPDYGYESDDCGGLITAYLGGINHIMDNTAVSLICESNAFELSTTWTEKSLWPVLSLTMPIWVGGYRQADEWRRMGFDAFDDVINHRYQHCYSMAERCYLAITDNLKLLQDTDHARGIRQKMIPRLLANRELMLSDHLTKFNNSIIESWPQGVQQVIMPSFLREFRGPPGYLNFTQKSNTP
jgi:hypothetical protein